MPNRQPPQKIGNVGDGAIVLQGQNLSLGLTSAQFEQLSQQVDKSIGDRSTRLAPAPSEQAPLDYVDRPEVTDPLLDHLLSVEPAQRGRALISAVHGLGGIGKTTVARWLVWRPEIEQRFPDGRIWVTLGNEATDAITVISDCVCQLDPTLKTKATLGAARADLAALLQDRSVLFVIDDVWPGRSADVAKALLVPSLRSRFLLTTRFPQIADDPGIRAADFPLDEMSANQAAELITRALHRDLSAAEQLDAERLCEIVGGHPLALELAAARIKEGRPWKALLDDLSAEIARLERLEETDDDLLADPIGGEARKRRSSVRASLLLSVRYLSSPAQRLLAWLGVVAEDAIITPRMAATLWSEEEETARGHLRTLSGLGLLSAKGDGYSIHDLMHHLARELLTAPEAVAPAGDIPGLGLTLQGAHRRLLGSYRAKTSNDLWHTLLDDGYIHNHLVRHFEQAGWESELGSLLWEESGDGHCGWYQAREQLGQTAGFLADVSRVWSYADRLGAAVSSEGLRAQAIGLQLHCALIIASINSLSAGIPAEVLLGSVRCGILSLPSALALARQHPIRDRRVDLLLALENEMQQSRLPSLLGEAIAVARGIDDAESRAKALAKVAQRLPAEEALVVVRGIEDAESRAEALAKVAQRLSAEEQSRVFAEALSAARSIDGFELDEALTKIVEHLPAERALAVARDIRRAWLRAPALAEVAQRLLAEDQPRVLREALTAARGVDDAWLRARALAEVAQRLTAGEQTSVLGEALNAARAMHSAGSGSGLLLEIAQRLPAEDALAVVRGIEDAESRAGALAEVAQRLPAKEALVVARGIDDDESRAKALAEVAQRLPTEEHSRVLVEALAVARGIDRAGPRAEALAEVARRLPVEQQPGVFGEALSAVRSIDDGEARAEALAEITQRLSAEEPLAVARGIDDGWARGRALAEVAQRLTEVEALAAVRGISDADTRAKALATVAQRLPAEDQPRVLREALTAARGVDDAWLRARALVEVAQRLPAEEQPHVVGEALSAARSIDDARIRARALAEVAQQLPPEEALAVALGIPDAVARFDALAKIAQRLPAEEALAVARGIYVGESRAKVLAEAAQRLPAKETLVVARGIDDDESRAKALAEVAQRLPAEEHSRVLVEALAVARGIDRAGPRANALAGVALRLELGQTSECQMAQWAETAHVLAMHARDDCVADFAALLPFIDALGGETVVRGLGRSIAAVGAWWP